MKKNPSLSLLSPVEDDEVLNNSKWRLEQGKTSLISYYGYKQVNQSLHIFYMHRPTIENMICSLELIGLIKSKSLAQDGDSEKAKTQLLTLLKSHSFNQKLISAIERLPTTPFDHKYNFDEDAWSERWERECSAYVIALYFLEDAISYVESGGQRELETINNWLRD
ncbi:hypothetical protein [Bdellovibrio bacteriovorus]|uniref:hypothetical protein n=1 Tax=Bdellovibrio bacteriovorus TaxID=959 RepID=UPI003AA8E056